MAGRTVTIHLDRDRQLFYDLNAVAEIGERLGITVRLSQIGEDVQRILEKDLPLSFFRTILWAGLRHEDLKLTEEAVGAMVTQDNITDVAKSFFELFGEIFSDTMQEFATGSAAVPPTSKTSQETATASQT